MTPLNQFRVFCEWRLDRIKRELLTVRGGATVPVIKKRRNEKRQIQRSNRHTVYPQRVPWQ